MLCVFWSKAHKHPTSSFESESPWEALNNIVQLFEALSPGPPGYANGKSSRKNSTRASSHENFRLRPQITNLAIFCNSKFV